MAEKGGQPPRAASKPIRDSPSSGRVAEKDGQPSVAAAKPNRDSSSSGRVAEKIGRYLPFSRLKPTRDSSSGAEKDGQSRTARKPNRDSTFRERSAEKVGSLRNATTGRARALAHTPSLVFPSWRGGMMCVSMFLLLLFPSPYVGGEEARGRSRLEPPGVRRTRRRITSTVR